MTKLLRILILEEDHLNSPLVSIALPLCCLMRCERWLKLLSKSRKCNHLNKIDSTELSCSAVLVLTFAFANEILKCGHLGKKLRALPSRVVLFIILTVQDYSNFCVKSSDGECEGLYSISI